MWSCVASLVIWYVVPLVIALLPTLHNTTALGDASLMQLMLTTILPSEFTVVLTAGKKLAGLPGGENAPFPITSTLQRDHWKSKTYLRAVMSQFFFSVGWSATHVTVFPSRVFKAVAFKLKKPAPLLELLKTGKESWAAGLPASHWHWYCSSVSFTDCTEHMGVPRGRSAERENSSNIVILG